MRSRNIDMIEKVPFGWDEQSGDEVLSLLRNVLEGLRVEVPVGMKNVVHGLCVVITQEWREATQSDKHKHAHTHTHPHTHTHTHTHT